MECNAIASVIMGPRPRKFAVLRSGPLPMTSICIAEMLKKQGGAVVHIVDRDQWLSPSRPSYAAGSAMVPTRCAFTVPTSRTELSTCMDSMLYSWQVLWASLKMGNMTLPVMLQKG